MSKTKNTTNLAFIILLLLAIGCSCPKLSDLGKKEPPAPPPSATPISTSSTPSTTPKGDYDVTMQKYNQLQIGTARTEVERILGGKGTEISSSVGGGVRFSR